MSTGAECFFWESKEGKWYYEIQRWPYGETEESDEHGPFASFDDAEDHLDSNYANPGGYGVSYYEDRKNRSAEAYRGPFTK
jgi:hypothetical protein